MSEITVAQAINEALAAEMRRDSRVFLMGQDIGRYGGLYGVTRGLLDEFGPERVREVPISEATFVAFGVGASLVGYRPVVEIQFVDFVTLAMEALVNEAAKAHYMSGGKACAPLVLRLPSGTGRGLAAQHSQNLEAWFTHIPGLKVVSATTPADAFGLLVAAIRDEGPVVFLEHCLLYPVKGELAGQDGPIPFGSAVVRRPGTSATVIAYGIMVHRALEAAEALAQRGIDIEVVDLRTLIPLDIDTITASARKTHRVVVAHEAYRTGGFGAEIAQRVLEKAFDYLETPIIRVAGADAPVPFNKRLEQEVVPQVADVVRGVETVLQ